MMVDETKKTDELAAHIEGITPPASAAKDATAAQPARAGTGPAHKRLSYGERKHLRRQKQAGEIKVTPRR
ncbi:hypothetical protein [Candidatus Amarolinea aalborgensis]|jgi:hypothetical protein|uniref:hypothetical protein n=1 Tax=Candidatus Amarolinea aalborgensis TaxID=2249329 RepID=UPI003BF9A350